MRLTRNVRIWRGTIGRVIGLRNDGTPMTDYVTARIVLCSTGIAVARQVGEHQGEPLWFPMLPHEIDVQSLLSALAEGTGERS